MTPEELKSRTKAFALRIVRVVEALPKTTIGYKLGDQLLRAGNSVGANYRAACRAKSKADFISKMGTVEEECDESIYWMEILIEAKIVAASRLGQLLKEAHEILAIIVASINTTRVHGQSAIRNPKSAISRGSRG